MSIDLEGRLQEELQARAGQVEPWRVGGARLRGVARARRTRRVRAATVTSVAVTVAVVVIVASVVSGGGRRADPPAGPTPSPTRAAGHNQLIHVSVSDAILDKARALIGDSSPQLYASATLPQSRDTVLVLSTTRPYDDNRRVVYTVTVHGGEILAGTLAYYRAGDDLVAQPARDGRGTTLVVVTPPGAQAATAEVTTSLAGRDVVRRTTRIDGGLALLPVSAAESVTRLRLVRDGETVQDTIPGDFHLGTEMPATAERVVVSSGTKDQSVQVRTDGRSACRLTVAGLAHPDGFALEWNPFDGACHAVDGKLRLLLARDRQYSSVAGIAPPGAEVVRLHWRSGAATDVDVAHDDVPAFLDTSGHRPDRLQLAEALDRDGVVIASTSP
jgi:hypothetical protein